MDLFLGYLRLGLLVVFALTAATWLSAAPPEGTATAESGNTPDAGADDPRPAPRLSETAIEFFRITSCEYTSQGKRVKTRTDPKKLSRLANAGDDQVTELVANISEFAQLRAQDLRIQQAFMQEVKQAPNKLRSSIIESLFTEENDFDSAAGNFEKALGGAHQLYADSLHTECRMLKLRMELFEQARGLASANVPKRQFDPEAISVELEKSSRKVGHAIITNRTDKTLHNVVIVARTLMQKDRIRAGAKPEMLRNQGVMTLLGYSAELADESAEIVELRRELLCFDQGNLAFVSEIAPGATLTMMVCQAPGTMALARRVEVSLWSDDVSCDGVKIPLLRKQPAEVKQDEIQDDDDPPSGKEKKRKPGPKGKKKKK